MRRIYFLFMVLALDCTWGALTWSPEEIISSTEEDANPPQVAVNENGMAIAIWHVFSPSDAIQAAVLPFEGSWSIPMTITAAAGVSSPQVVLTDAGEAIATWRRSGEIEASLYSGGTWSMPVVISTGGPSAKSSQKMATNQEGSPTLAVVVWENNLGATRSIEGNAFQFGVGWGSPVTIQAAATEGLGDPRPDVAVQIGGTKAIAVWAQFDGASPIMASANANPLSMAWGSATAISELSENGATPQIAMDSSGQAVVVWEESGSEEVNGTAFTSGSWELQQSVAPFISGEPADQSEVALSPTGSHAVAVWRRMVGGDFVIQSSRLTLGGMWDAAQDVSSPGGASSAAVGIDSNQDSVAVWAQDGQTSVADFASGGSWSSPFSFPTDINSASDPRVAINSEGYAVLVWVDINGESGTGTIYSSHASFFIPPSILPPSFLTGQRKKDQYPLQLELFNRLEWGFSPSSDVAGYKIYRNGSFIAQVPASQNRY